MADSPNLQPLSQLPNPAQPGYVAAYFLPQADLLQEPVADSPGLISRDLVLAAGAGWRCPSPWPRSSSRKRPKPTGA